ncbi:MAG TPA: GTPase, partial [Planctomycetota bacterium]|nr:GTPase [Planctomycetota bacterium]
APLELALDFSDQDVEIVSPPDHAARVRALAVELEAFAAPGRGAARRTQRRVVLRGPANAGKSTLFNALLRREAAIASPLRGTTRDVLAGAWARGDAAAWLVDTAGDDVDEREVDRLAAAARRRAEAEADVVLEVRDARRRGYPEIPRGGATVLRVATFADLAGPADLAAAAADDAFVVAAPSGVGLDALEAKLARALLGDRGAQEAADDAPFLVTDRAAGLFADAATALKRGAEALETLPPELGASDLRVALRALRDVVGDDAADPVLDRIFRDFCIGK